MATISDQLDGLLSLEDGWDSYGAKKIDHRIVDIARLLLSYLPPEMIDSAQVVPLSDGGVQVEWHYDGRDVEIVIY